MSVEDILLSQLLDPFRWALLIGLMVTMVRTEATTGRVVPLLAGAAFVALVIPMTMGAPEGEPLARAAILGLVANGVALAVLLALLEGWRRFRR